MRDHPNNRTHAQENGTTTTTTIAGNRTTFNPQKQPTRKPNRKQNTREPKK
jgi:hypothetical protein